MITCSDDIGRFKVLPRRSVVERTFGLLVPYREALFGTTIRRSAAP